jgi:hypothetical protein
MKFQSFFPFPYAAFLVLCSLLHPGAVLAGPPLICHAFDIGEAKSLPWMSYDWNLTGNETYDTKNLPVDTIALLDSNSTVLVHMETIRRAALYGRKDPPEARQLLTRLLARTESTSNSAQAALAYFDAGYFAETLKQWTGKDESNPAQNLDGYGLVKKAIHLRGYDAQMEFAAALITLNGPAGEHQEYTQKALAGAKNDPLLARNLARRAHGSQSETMAEMLSHGSNMRTAKQ